jgi:hypothetical protein
MMQFNIPQQQGSTKPLPTTPNTNPRSRSPLFLLFVLLCVGVCAGTAGLGAAMGYAVINGTALQNPLLRMVVPSCSLGVVGTEASITFTGWAASKPCEESQQQTDTRKAKGFYILTTEPVTPIVCEGDHDGYHYKVRDTGMFKIIGNALCASLHKVTAVSVGATHS